MGVYGVYPSIVSIYPLLRSKLFVASPGETKPLHGGRVGRCSPVILGVSHFSTYLGLVALNTLDGRNLAPVENGGKHPIIYRVLLPSFW